MFQKDISKHTCHCKIPYVEGQNCKIPNTPFISFGSQYLHDMVSYNCWQTIIPNMSSSDELISDEFSHKHCDIVLQIGHQSTRIKHCLNLSGLSICQTLLDDL